MALAGRKLFICFLVWFFVGSIFGGISGALAATQLTVSQRGHMTIRRESSASASSPEQGSDISSIPKVKALSQSSSAYSIDMQAFNKGSTAARRAEAFQNACDRASEKSAVWSLNEQYNLCGRCMLLTNFFMADHPSREGFGWGTNASEAFKDKRNCNPEDPYCSMKMYIESARRSGCCVTVLHDGSMPQKYILEHAQDKIRFASVNVTKYDEMFGRRFNLNDVRYFNFHEMLCDHKGLQKVFISDLFDVQVGSSPCKEAEEGKLYIGVDNDKFKSAWLEERFRWMGGEYLKFYANMLKKEKRPMWSAGIIGAGDRETMASFLAKLLAVLTDGPFPGPTDDSGRPKTWFQGVNMAAVNFVAEYYFKGRAKGGEPVNSKYRAYQRNRHDVWFIHK